MKITVNKDEKLIRLRLGHESGQNPYLSITEIEHLFKNYYGCVSDINYVVKRYPNKLLVFYDEKLTWKCNMNTERFLKVLLDLPLIVKEVIYRNTYYRDFEIDTDSFDRYPDYSFPDYNWMDILKHHNFMPDALRALRNASKLPKPYVLQLKQKLIQVIDHAIIMPDSYGKNCLDFYFDGRNIPDGCGYNGGIIFHGSHDGYGSGSAPTFSVCINPTDGYSIHT